MVKSACVGFCRSSDNKKLGEMVGSFVNGKITEHELKNYCKNVRLENLKMQKDIGTDIIPSNDFSMYDHMLDATCLVGNIQRRYYWEGGKIPLEIYFSLTNGVQKDKFDVSPLKLQNWLNTNYLYHVPEFVSPIDFTYSDNKPIVEYLDGANIGIETRSTVIAPMTYLLQGKSLESGIAPIDLIEDILPVYRELFINYKRINVKDVQIEDPMIGLAIDREMKSKYKYCYDELKKYADGINLHLVTYYCSLYENFDFICSLPVDSIHIDTTYNYEHMDEYLSKVQKGMHVSLGVVDARNVWKNNLSRSIDVVSKFCDKIGSDNVVVATSSPLFLCPYSLELEKNLPANLKNQLSFAVEKLQEIEVIKKAINFGTKTVSDVLSENKKLFSNKVYDYNFGDVENDKIVKRESKWCEFAKKNKFNAPSLMFSSGNDVELQNNTTVDIVSAGISNKSYDISVYKNSSDGIFVTEGNVIPRFGREYYSPAIIYNYVEIYDDVFQNIVSTAQRKTDKPMKFCVCSPLHFMNFAFVSPFIDTEKNYKKICKNLAKCINDIADKIDVLQINEATFMTGRSLNKLKSVEEIKLFCKRLNSFIGLIKNIKCVILYNSFCEINEFIEIICKINIDLLLLSSARSCYNILDTFIKYRPSIPIGFSLVDLYSVRVSTKNEMTSIIKKVLSVMDRHNLVFSVDGEICYLQQIDGVNKSLKNIESACKVVIKEMEKRYNGDKSESHSQVKKVKQKSSKKKEQDNV